MRQALCYLLALAAGLTISCLIPGASPGMLPGAWPRWEALIEPALFVLMVCTFAELPLAQRGNAQPASGQVLGEVLDDVHPTKTFLLVLGACNFLVVPGIVLGLVAALNKLYEQPGFAGLGDDGLGGGTEAIIMPAALVLLAPCIDYVVAFTKQMGGNFLRLLAATPVLLIGQILVVPFWLWLLGVHIEISQAWPVVRAALLFLVLPLTLVLVLRNKQWLRKFSARAMDPAMWVVLAAIAAAYGALVVGNLKMLVPLMLVYVAFAILAFGVASAMAWVARLRRKDRVAVAMSAMTRNSLVVLPIAAAVAPVHEVAVIVVVTQTAVELMLICLLLAMRKIAS